MSESMAIVVHSGDMDTLYSTLIIGNGAVAMGMDVTLYFTFWGLERLVKGKLERGPLSKMNFLGIGRRLMRRRMRKANVASLERLLSDFRSLGGRIIACEMTMEVMGIDRQSLRQDWIDEYGAVGTFIRDARRADVTFFI